MAQTTLPTAFAASVALLIAPASHAAEGYPTGWEGALSAASTVDATPRYYPLENPVRFGQPQHMAQLGLSQQQQQAFDASAHGAMAEAGGPPKKEGWSYAVGAGAMYGPAYAGSDKYVVNPVPDISVDYNDGLFFANIFDGIGSYPIQGEDYKIGASLGFDFGRREKDDRKNLHGMGDIDMAPTANLMGEYGIGPVRISGKLSKGTDDYGTTASLDVGTMFPASDDVMLMVSAGPVWADADHMNSYFGVSSGQAARSGYGRYEADAGLKSVGITMGAFYAVTEEVDVKFMVKADQLLGDAADSPLTKDEFQPSAFLTTSYKF